MAPEPALHTPTPRGRSPDPNKGGRRIKGGGGAASSRCALGSETHSWLSAVCALWSGAGNAGLLQLRRASPCDSREGTSPHGRVAAALGPLRRASLPRPRLSQLSLASRGECDGRWAPSGSGQGDALLGGGGQALRAAPTPACAALYVKFSRCPASPGCGPRTLRESRLVGRRAQSYSPPRPSSLLTSSPRGPSSLGLHQPV